VSVHPSVFEVGRQSVLAANCLFAPISPVGQPLQWNF
jgi:hypothetical protein